MLLPLDTEDLSRRPDLCMSCGLYRKCISYICDQTTCLHSEMKWKAFIYMPSFHTAKNVTDMLQVVNFTCWRVATNLSMSSSFATSLLKPDLLQRVVACSLVTTCWNNLQQGCGWQVLTINVQQVCSTTWNRLVENDLWQAMGIYNLHDIDLLMSKSVDCRCQRTCCNLRILGCGCVCVWKILSRCCNSGQTEVERTRMIYNCKNVENIVRHPAYRI